MTYRTTKDLAEATGKSERSARLWCDKLGAPRNTSGHAVLDDDWFNRVKAAMDGAKRGRPRKPVDNTLII